MRLSTPKVFALLVVALAIVHGHDGTLFTRDFIAYDDQHYLAPLARLDLRQYLTEFLPQRRNYAYPLRDLTLALDFWLSGQTGFKTFWAMNLVWFAMALGFVNKVLETLWPDRPRARWFLLAAYALHPVNVEALQWLSSRKHVLAGLFIAWGTWVVLRGRRGEWRKILACYAASLLCWPTGLGWIVWAFFARRHELLAARARGLATVLAGGGIAWCAMHFLFEHNADYASGLTSALAPREWSRWWLFETNALGRAFFNLLFPVRLAAYYDIYSPLNAIGLAGAALALAILLAWPRARRFCAPSLALLFGALFFPMLVFQVGSSSDFILSDRYFHVALPYGLAALGGLRLKGAWPRVAGVLTLALYAAISFRDAPAWRDAYTLMRRCAEREGSPMCLATSIEQGFDRGGCAQVYGEIIAARGAFDRRRAQIRTNFNADLPLYDAFCTATLQSPYPERERELRSLRAFYGPEPGLLFGEGLLVRERAAPQQAYEFLRQAYLAPPRAVEGANNKIINVWRGQGAAACTELARQAPAFAECQRTLRDFLQSLAHVPWNEAQVQWAFRRSLAH